MVLYCQSFQQFQCFQSNQVALIRPQDQFDLLIQVFQFAQEHQLHHCNLLVLEDQCFLKNLGYHLHQFFPQAL